MSTANDAALARSLAGAAGVILRQVRASGVFPPAALAKAGDEAANRFLVDALREARPDDGLLSEEMKCNGARLAMSRVWIIDPVDGTREFSEARTDWAVHVGLAIDGEPSVGAVALPDMDLVLCSERPMAIRPPAGPLRIVVSRTRPASEAIALARALDAELVPMGSAGAKAMAVVRGEADIYLHSGGQYEWDSMAPVAVARACGVHCSRLDGSPLRYNRADVYLPDLLICPAALAPKVLALIADTMPIR